MKGLPFVAVVLATLTLSACSKDSSSLLGPSGTPGGSSSGTGSGGGPGTPSIQAVDTTAFTPSDTGSAGNTGSSTAVLFSSSGIAEYGDGTCGPNGVWTDSLGNVSSPYNSHCIAYRSDGSAGDNGKGKCVTSLKGYPGLWLNPGGHATAPYHTQCVELGATTSTLTLSFPAQATVYTAKDGSGQQVLNFATAGTTVAQLVYHGSANDYTTGAGTLSGTDGSAGVWTIDFTQTALNYTMGVMNGNLITVLTSTGTQVIACQAAVGCSLITLKLTVAP